VLTSSNHAGIRWIAAALLQPAPVLPNGCGCGSASHSGLQGTFVHKPAISKATLRLLLLPAGCVLIELSCRTACTTHHDTIFDIVDQHCRSTCYKRMLQAVLGVGIIAV
jgi:hypothetical protein